MRYVVARYKERQREEAYRIYVTDSLYYRVQNKYIARRYHDLFSADIVETDSRTAEEIVADVIKRANLTIGGGKT